MTPGVRTEAEYRVRTILGPGGRSWIIRDEYDDHGEVIGSQQLGSDGRWGTINLPGTELWDGDEFKPTTMGSHNRVPGNYTQIIGKPFLSSFVSETTTATYPSMMTVNASTITATTSSTTPFLDALSKSHTG